jgi:DNA-binding GntR family transcriptional regulator
LANKLKKITLKEQAYQALREMIASHRFSSGTWINTERLADELGVSRTPVWQALKELETEGLVRHEPNRGIRMVEMTPEMALDLYQVRGELEAMAAKLAANLISAQTIKRMEAIIGKQGKLVAEGDVVGYSMSDFEFHALLYDSCGNWLLRELLENIKGKARPFVRNITPILKGLYEDHQKLMKALKKGDSKAAAQAMRNHNNRVRRLMEQTVKKEKGQA